MSAPASSAPRGAQAAKLVILGTYAGAEAFADLVGDCADYDLVAFAENRRPERCDRPLLGRPVVWVDELRDMAGTHRALCAIGTVARTEFCEQVEALGMPFATLRHPSAHVGSTAMVGPGTTVSPGVVIAAFAELGCHVIVSRGCLIGHHTRIGDYVTLAPGANVASGVTIGDGTFIGMGANVLDGLTVGRRSVVGAGAVITRDVPDHVQVQGVPARVVKTGVDGR